VPIPVGDAESVGEAVALAGVLEIAVEVSLAEGESGGV
jgi:hypothetical protein